MTGQRAWSAFGSVIGVAIALTVWRILAGTITIESAAGVGPACAALLPAACVLTLMVVTQMLLRVRTGALDPLTGGDGPLLRVNQRVLTNTVEQLAVFAPSLLALAAAAPPAWLPSIVAAGWVFALARVMFWGGYLLGPLLRAPGMAATFTVNVATLIAACWVWWR